MAVMTENARPPAQPTPAVWAARPSVIVDWSWALFDKSECDDGEYPVRERRFDRAPGLLERIRAFWADGESEWIELVHLARLAGCLWERDPERILAGLRRVVDRPGGREVFDSETPENARIIRRRLRRLRSDPKLAERWLALIADVASALEPERERNWIVAETAARPLAAEAVPATQIPQVQGSCAPPEAILARVQEAVDAGGEAVIVPSRVSGKGFFLSFGDLVLISCPAAGPIEPTEAARDVARTLRAMADPTRLTILEQLAIRPRRVGDLARDLALSQPTISNHVRLLRDAALVVEGPRGSERLLSVAPEAVDEALERSRRLVLGTSSPLHN
jgi:DNA-binding transcriptional ArsR family regulator